MVIGPAPDWTQVNWMVGNYEGTPVLIAVDPDGKMIGIMYGSYEGVLKPLAVDADGRIIALTTDPADVWGNAISMGNAELGAVLSPVKRFDRRGSVLFWDSFEDGISKVVLSSSGGGASTALSSAYGQFGSFSVRLTCGNLVGDTAEITRRQFYTELSKIGLECAFSLESQDYFLDLIIRVFDGSTQRRFNVRWDRVNDSWDVQTGLTTWVSLSPTMNLREDYSSFQVAKMVVDPVTNKFVRLVANGQTYDLSGYSNYTIASTLAPYILCRVLVETQVNANATIYVDDIIITQNEPA